MKNSLCVSHLKCFHQPKTNVYNEIWRAHGLSFLSMAGEEIIRKHHAISVITYRINNKGDDESEDLILNAVSERTDNALLLINSCNLSTLNTLRQPLNNRSLLHICVGNGWYRAVVQLLKRSVNVNVIDEEQYTPLMLALLNLTETEIFKALLTYDEIDINYRRVDDGLTVLHLAMIHDRDQHFKLLLRQTKHPLHLNLVTHSGKTFLHLMADFKSRRCLNVIKRCLVDDDLWKERDLQGYPPIFIALIRWPYSSFTRSFLLFLLHRSSTSLLLQDNQGKTILHWAIFNHYLVKLIMDTQWLNLSPIKDNFGRTPLDYADDQQLGKSLQYLRV